MSLAAGPPCRTWRPCTDAPFFRQVRAAQKIHDERMIVSQIVEVVRGHRRSAGPLPPSSALGAGRPRRRPSLGLLLHHGDVAYRRVDLAVLGNGIPREPAIAAIAVAVSGFSKANCDAPRASPSAAARAWSHVVRMDELHEGRAFMSSALHPSVALQRRNEAEDETLEIRDAERSVEAFQIWSRSAVSLRDLLLNVALSCAGPVRRRAARRCRYWSRTSARSCRPRPDRHHAG